MVNRIIAIRFHPAGGFQFFLLSVFSHPYPLLSGIIGLKMRSRSILVRGGAIMEPFYYYWSMWFLWILATFIFAKTKSRFYVSVFILTNMMASIHQITAYFTLNAAYVMFLLRHLFMREASACINGSVIL